MKRREADMPIDHLETVTNVPSNHTQTIANVPDGEVTAIPVTVHPLAAFEGSYKALADYIIKLEKKAESLEELLTSHIIWHDSRNDGKSIDRKSVV
jgi:hypothetical protein